MQPKKIYPCFAKESAIQLPIHPTYLNSTWTKEDIFIIIYV